MSSICTKDGLRKWHKLKELIDRHCLSANHLDTMQASELFKKSFKENAVTVASLVDTERDNRIKKNREILKHVVKVCLIHK